MIKQAWPLRQTPRNDGYVYNIINMHVCKSTNSLKYKRRRKRRRRIAPTRRIRRDKKRRIRRNLKGEQKGKRIIKRKDPKTIEKKNQKKLGRMVAPVHNFDPKILPEGSAKLRWAMREAGGPLWGGARSAPFGVAMSPKRRVRAAHGRARAAKTHQFIIYLSRILCLYCDSMTMTMDFRFLLKTGV